MQSFKSAFSKPAFLATFALLLFITNSFADSGWKHGDTLFGELKYKQDFSHYEHVNPDAPKGGTLNRSSIGGFDSFNPFVVTGRPAPGLNFFGGLLYDTLFTQSVDQSSASYGLVARAFKHGDDYSWASYQINENAKWHDGKPITPEDVIWSLEQITASQPLFKDYFKNVASAEKTGEHEVTFKFDTKGNRELPHIMGDLPIVPKHWWEGTNAKGEKRNFSQPLNDELPLGNGPYKIASYKMGDSIIWERVDDYWAKELNVRKGRYNFDRIKYTNFENGDAAWEGFKKGNIADTNNESRSRRWKTEYIFPAFKRGDVIKKEFPTEGSKTYQAYFFNTRNKKFADKNLREALFWLFDFETLNKNVFFNAYTRTDSYFEGGELQAQNMPEGRELEILKEYKGRIDEQIFKSLFVLPVIKGPQDTRTAQRKALGLLKKAGYSFENGKMLNQDKSQFTIEILGNSPTDEIIGIPYVENLRKLGIKAELRIVDPAQYKARMDAFDFEITNNASRQSLSPGNEQREYWSSDAADRAGARNYAGIKDPVIDELIERIIIAPDRKELVALTKALDRILLRGFYSIPMWHNPNLWYAWWRKVKFPPNQPPHIGVDLFSGWIDVEIEKLMQK